MKTFISSAIIILITLSSLSFSQLMVYDIPLDSVKADVLQDTEYLMKINKKFFTLIAVLV